MLIVNLSDLNYEEIGSIIDDYFNGDEIDIEDKFLVEFKNKMYCIKTRSLKKYFKVIVYNW